MPDHDTEIRARMRRALGEAEAGSRRRAKGALPRRRRAIAPALPVFVALAAAVAVIVGIIAVAPHLRRTAVADHPTPAPSVAPARPTLLPTLAATPPPPTAVPSRAAGGAPLPPKPAPTPAWSPPPQTVTEPQLIYVVTGGESSAQEATLHLAELDWTGAVRGSLDVSGINCQCIGVPEKRPATYLPSPDGSRVIVGGTRIVAPDGAAAGALPAGATSVAWDGDNRHLCRLDGPQASRLSWVAPGASRPVTTLRGAGQDDFWWVVACSSARNRIVVARISDPPNATLRMVEMRSIELSSGHVVHATAITTSGYFPQASGDGSVVAIGGSDTTVFYDPDTGTALHTTPGFVEHVSWSGNRALVSSPDQTTTKMVDWRSGTVLWSQSVHAVEWWGHQLSDDLAYRYTQPGPTSPPGTPNSSVVVVVKPDGTASSHTIPTS